MGTQNIHKRLMELGFPYHSFSVIRTEKLLVGERFEVIFSADVKEKVTKEMIDSFERQNIQYYFNNPNT